MVQEKILEALLFASGESVHAARLAEAAGIDAPMARSLLSHMAESYAAESSGILLIEMDDSFQLCVNPAYNDSVRKLVQSSPKKSLTQPLLETLSIIAYRQPVTKNVIEEIRGVNADHAVNRLLEYGLVMERGRSDAPGRPILFGTTEDFLRFYGLRNLGELFRSTGFEERGEPAGETAIE
jgi:segregation and condensation protein B